MNILLVRKVHDRPITSNYRRWVECAAFKTVIPRKAHIFFRTISILFGLTDIVFLIESIRSVFLTFGPAFGCIYQKP